MIFRLTLRINDFLNLYLSGFLFKFLFIKCVACKPSTCKIFLFITYFLLMLKFIFNLYSRFINKIHPSIHISLSPTKPHTAIYKTETQVTGENFVVTFLQLRTNCLCYYDQLYCSY